MSDQPALFVMVTIRTEHIKSRKHRPQIEGRFLSLLSGQTIFFLGNRADGKRLPEQPFSSVIVTRKQKLIAITGM